jgi:hypothetical protein
MSLRAGQDAYLHALRTGADFPPADRLVGGGTSVTSIEFGARINIHGVICPVAHEIGITYVVFDETSPKDYHTGTMCAQGNGVDSDDVGDNVERKMSRRVRAESVFQSVEV